MIRIAPGHQAAIRAHAEESYPNECCGFLLGRAEDGVKVVASVRRAANGRFDSPRNRYVIAPGEQLAADREARRDGLDVVGFYHSHPDAPARPSEYDREHAWPWYTYLIVPVTSGRAGGPRAWVLRDFEAPFEAESMEEDDASAGIARDAGGTSWQRES